MVNIFYRRPKEVSPEDVASWPETINPDEMRKQDACPSGIPSGLSFDRIIDGRTCYPCRLRDFMFYLRFVELSAENLRFYLWYKSYCERFQKLSAEEKALSPPYIPNNNRKGDWIIEADDKSPPDGLEPSRTNSTAENLDIDMKENVTICDDETAEASTLHDPYNYDSNMNFTNINQPFRSEISRVASLFLYPSSPLELNLSYRERHLALQALRTTTHPSAFTPALLTAERFLRWQSHPNFVRRQVSNASPARTTVMLLIGVLATVLMLASAVPLVLSNKPKPWRIFPAGLGSIAIVSLFCRERDFCWAFFSRGGRRSTDPWDMPGSDSTTSNNNIQKNTSEDVEADAVAMERRDSKVSITTTVHDFEFPGERIAAENVRVFEQKGFTDKGFEIGVRVQDNDVRRIQLGIYLQMWLLWVIGTGFLCAILMPLPKVGLIK